MKSNCNLIIHSHQLVWSILLLIWWQGAIGFTTFTPTSHFVGRINSPLFGISEWRDLPPTMGHTSSSSSCHAPIRRVPILLVPSEQVALQGEKKYFHFKTDDEVRLFQQAIDNNHGIFGLGLLVMDNNNGAEVVLDRFPLLEITDHNMNLGVDMGIFCTAQVVGRASMLTLEHGPEDKESSDDHSIPATVICTELFDERETHYDLEDANSIAKQVVETIGKLCNQEQRRDVIRTTSNDNLSSDDIDERETRKDRFRCALHAAFQSDSQGYIDPHCNDLENIVPETRSWKEINAISWAAFSSGLTPQIDETYRLHAMDMERATNRLKLASFWLSDVLAEVESSTSR